MSELPTPKTLNEAMLAVMHRVPYVLKSKTDGLRYSFASEAELIANLHPALTDNGLTIRPVAMDLKVNEQYQTKNGAQMNHVIIAVDYELRHSPSQECATVSTLGEASDSGDKAIPKAMTCALKYALREMFLVETGDDPDRQGSDGDNARLSPYVTPEGVSTLAKMLFEAKVTQTAFCKAMGIAKLDQLPREKYAYAVDRILAKSRQPTN